MTFIVCEVGSNWTNLQDCLDSIVAAKECGADAVKYQLYTHRELYGYDGEMDGELPFEWVPILADKCKEVSIEFMCTAFSPIGYQMIDPYVKRHKIASAETSDPNIWEMVVWLSRPILFSTGGSTFQEIMEPFELYPEANLTAMYCVSVYPSDNACISKAGVDRLQRRLGNRVGYSCHTTTGQECFAAAQIGATVIEKHFKIRDMNTPDNPHSILPEEFKFMVSQIRSLIPDEQYIFPNPDEADFIKYSKRRWVPELNGYYRTKKT
jgi:N-acetylneuraminate synthase